MPAASPCPESEPVRRCGTIARLATAERNGYLDRMAQGCLICDHADCPTINAVLRGGQPVAEAFRQFPNVSRDSLYRHARKGHHLEARQGPALAPGTANGAPHDATLMPAISATLRDVQRLAREAQRHLRDARKAGDHKATNGAITAASKALELVAKLRGELQHGQSVNVNVSVEAKQAMDVHSAASSLEPRDVTELARAHLAALIEAGDAHAAGVVLELVRMLPSAEVDTDGAHVPDAAERSA